MTLVVEVLHNSLRHHKSEKTTPSGWHEVLARELAKRSPDLDIECWGPDRFASVGQTWEDDLGVVHRTFPSLHLRYGVELSVKMLMYLRKALREQPPSLVHLHGVYNLNTYVLSSLYGSRLPMVAQFHDPADEGGWFLGHGRSGSREIALRSVKRFIAASEAMKRTLSPRVRSRTEVLPFGVDLRVFQPLDRTLARRVLHLEQDLIYGMFVGRLVPSKGVQHLLESVPLILHECPNFHLIIIGEGPMGDGLLASASSLGIREHLTFEGGVEHSVLPTYYSAADLLIHPSHREVGTLVVLESLACGTPVVATPVGFIPEVSRKVGGISLISSSSPRPIAEAVTETSRNPSQLSKSIRRSGIEEYGWDSISKRVLALYKEICS